MIFARGMALVNKAPIMAKESGKMKFATCIAPSNIATIKYWGKRNEELILPCNDSISVTLSVDLMHAKTTVCASPSFKENKIWLNGIEESFNGNPRLVNCLNDIQNRAREEGDGRSDGIYDWKIHVCSENNFPTAAGLASSAAGYACLVYCLAQLYNVSGDLTTIARRGSGSACRSLHGGFVQWHQGTLNDGSDSRATQIAAETHWPDLRVLILIVMTEKKETSSSSGMKRSIYTSELFPQRIKECVPARVNSMVDAIKNKDFPRFAEITMRDSNQFHAICLDTYPPAVYMNDVSHGIASVVHAFNSACSDTRLAYTFDAGSNACLFTLKETVPLVLSLIEYFYPQALDDFKGEKVERVAIPDDLLRGISLKPRAPGLIKGIIHSDVGQGPRSLDVRESLLDEAGLPRISS